ncbi:MAG: undecaprenyl-phosphate glucose phosphotransferase [Steroidobacteraceae bacterium]
MGGSTSDAGLRDLPRRSAVFDRQADRSLPLAWVRAGAGETTRLWLIKDFLNPGLAVIALILCMLWANERFSSAYGILMTLAFVLTVQMMSRPSFEHLQVRAAWVRRACDILVEWCYVIVTLAAIGVVFQVTRPFSRHVLLLWCLLAPVMMFGAQAIARAVTEWRRRHGAIRRRLVIIGATRVGLELSERLAEEPWLGVVDGFFDDRRPDRLPRASRAHLLGRTASLVEYSRRNRVHGIYICLPISAQPRIRALLDELKDATASIYMVPDLSAFDLMQARLGEVRGMPLIAVRETPFCGMAGVLKRATDIVLASAALLLFAPVLLAVAIAVRCSSPGPVLFRQRRYGLDGREFTVCKFRSMTVCEDQDVPQARRNDPRVTRVGRFLRKSSLDELPQLFNVLGGSMSLVGPRPHAVSHNEHYRKVVSGYMLRHKVRPGITGLAQIRGLRGETRNLDAMCQRVHLDIEYVKNWSLGLDLFILLRTVLLVFGDRRAY